VDPEFAPTKDKDVKAGPGIPSTRTALEDATLFKVRFKSFPPASFSVPPFKLIALPIKIPSASTSDD
jgi:hypothetical protein